MLIYPLVNGYDLGGRNLVVNTADNDSSPSNFTGGSYVSSGPASYSAAPTAAPLQPITTGAPSFGLEAVNSIIASLSNQQISDIIMQFKVQLAQALYHCLKIVEPCKQQSDAGFTDFSSKPGTSICCFPKSPKFETC